MKYIPDTEALKAKDQTWLSLNVNDATAARYKKLVVIVRLSQNCFHVIWVIVITTRNFCNIRSVVRHSIRKSNNTYKLCKACAVHCGVVSVMILIIRYIYERKSWSESQSPERIFEFGWYYAAL